MNASATASTSSSTFTGIKYVHNITIDQYEHINQYYNDPTQRTLLYQQLLQHNITTILQFRLNKNIIAHICQYIATPSLPHHLQTQYELELKVQSELHELLTKQLQLHDNVLLPTQQMADYELQSKLERRLLLKQQYAQHTDTAG